MGEGAPSGKSAKGRKGFSTFVQEQEGSCGQSGVSPVDGGISSRRVRPQPARELQVLL